MMDWGGAMNIIPKQGHKLVLLTGEAGNTNW